MRCIIPLTPAFALLALACLPACVTERVGAGRPGFDRYPVRESFARRPAPVDLSSNPRAPEYRDELTRAETAGPNFAGHYTIFVQDCGARCKALYVIDATNGKVYFPGLMAPGGFDYRRDSTLLITNPKSDESEIGTSRREYYNWAGDVFVQLQVGS